MSVSDKEGTDAEGKDLFLSPGKRCHYCGLADECKCPDRCGWCGRQVPKGKNLCGESKCRGLRRVPQADKRGNPINPQGFVCEWCGISTAGTLHLQNERGDKMYHCGAMDCMKGLRELCRVEVF